ncbi:MAG: V-type proton ATPase subunit E [Chlamydiales bacterium]|nr:V-type proton ATPase subunit E [Chlamydiales bacterium]MCH9619166.1 V-type proton ATPase subunit E [Chlamydiales bacterium]MCH9622428.1 V-type proton ATPase subunit E [Chlamydiales bacterium]
MNSLDSGKDKIKKICEVLKNETIQPAKVEAASIVEQAEKKAQGILREAEKKSQEMVEAAAKKNSEERKLFESSLRQACKQGIEELRQEIEKKLLNESLIEWVADQTTDSKVSAKLVSILVESIEKEGIGADFSALIPKVGSPKEVNALLIDSIVKKLKEKSVVVGEFMGGVQLKLHDRKLTLDVTEESLVELFKLYLHKDFRDRLFQ